MNLLHTMLRVGNLEQSVDFYTRVLGMNLLRTTDRPDQGYSLAFVGYGDGNKSGHAEIELTYNYDVMSIRWERHMVILQLVPKIFTRNVKAFDPMAEISRENQDL